jgi:hypothetical protein
MLPQAPEFDRFLRPCPIGRLHAGCTMGPGLRRDGVICSEGAMKANWITASKGRRPWQKWVPAFPTEQVRGLKAHGKAQEGDAALIYLNAGEH